MEKRQTEMVKRICRICSRTVRSNAKSICCEICKKEVHARCNFISNKTYLKLKDPENGEVFHCSKCLNEKLPFSCENDNIFNQTNTLGLNTECNLDDISIKIDRTQQKTINLISQIILANSDNENTNLGKYYSIDDFNTKISKNKNFFSLFHLNIHSLQLHKSDLDILLDMMNIEFDVIAISETKIKKDKGPTHDITIPNYTIVSTPTEAEKGGTLLYISENIESKQRKDLEMYEEKKIESTLIEITNKKR